MGFNLPPTIHQPANLILFSAFSFLNQMNPRGLSFLFTNNYRRHQPTSQLHQGRTPSNDIYEMEPSVHFVSFDVLNYCSSELSLRRSRKYRTSHRKPSGSASNRRLHKQRGKIGKTKPTPNG